jgi:hypothetical protein
VHLTKSQFDELVKQTSNWGRWGKDDQLGTLNLITPARRKEAAAQVREGVSVSLARDLNAEKSIDNPAPFRDTMTLGVDDKFNVDTRLVFTALRSAILTRSRTRTMRVIFTMASPTVTSLRAVQTYSIRHATAMECLRAEY